MLVFDLTTWVNYIGFVFVFFLNKKHILAKLIELLLVIEIRV